MEQWIPEIVGPGFDVQADPQAARDVQGSARARDEPDAIASGQPGRRSRGERRRVPHRRVAEANRGRGRPRQHHDRSGRGAADRTGHAVPVARSGDRGLHRLRRRVLARLQLRVPEHHLVELAVDAAADGHQSARRVRADVRTGRQPGAARRAHRATSAACSTRSPRKRASSTRPRRARSSRASATTSTTFARSSGASSAPRRSDRVDVNDRRAGRRARLVRGARRADVRPAGRRLSGRRDARLHVHAVARAEPADLSATSASPSSITPCRITATMRRRSRRT